LWVNQLKVGKPGEMLTLLRVPVADAFGFAVNEGKEGLANARR
jgi:hypothetical protein